MSELCKRKGVEIIAAECMPDYVHMFAGIPPKYSVSEIMGYLKRKSSLMIFDRHANLKYKYGNRTWGKCKYPVGDRTIRSRGKADILFQNTSSGRS